MRSSLVECRWRIWLSSESTKPDHPVCQIGQSGFYSFSQGLLAHVWFMWQQVDNACCLCKSDKFFCLQVKIQEMKEKETDALDDKDGNSHVCKVCFESAAAAVLLPCRHFCCKHVFNILMNGIHVFNFLIFLSLTAWFSLAVCKPCSLACSECPLCRQRIADRIITFTWITCH
jgi:hypothetical protein